MDPLDGHVVVLATESDAANRASRLLRHGVLLAVVTTDGTGLDAVEALVFRADPADPATWDRVAPHIEQRVGPIDAALADPGALDAVRDAFEPDMLRRGHGAIVRLRPSEDPVAVLRRRLSRRR